jgi:hypothetical protein
MAQDAGVKADPAHTQEEFDVKLAEYCNLLPETAQFYEERVAHPRQYQRTPAAHQSPFLPPNQSAGVVSNFCARDGARKRQRPSS